jgi:hypothetical protein
MHSWIFLLFRMPDEKTGRPFRAQLRRRKAMAMWGFSRLIYAIFAENQCLMTGNGGPSKRRPAIAGVQIECRPKRNFLASSGFAAALSLS